MKIIRPDKMPGHRAAYEKNRKKILSTQNICGICGKEIDMTLKTPTPLAPCVDQYRKEKNNRSWKQKFTTVK